MATTPVASRAAVAALQRYDWSGWTEWTPFPTLDLKTVPSRPGAYVLSTTRPINRAIGTDPMGILDIGETRKGYATLQGRLGDMRRCIMRRGDEGHMAGWRFSDRLDDVDPKVVVQRMRDLAAYIPKLRHRVLRNLLRLCIAELTIDMETRRFDLSVQLPVPLALRQMDRADRCLDEKLGYQLSFETPIEKPVFLAKFQGIQQHKRAPFEVERVHAAK